MNSRTVVITQTTFIDIRFQTLAEWFAEASEEGRFRPGFTG